MDNKTTIFGSLGAGIAALCCFTPVLVIGLTAAGVVGIIAYLDYVLFPLLGFFIFLTAYGLTKKRRQKECIVSSKSQAKE